MKCFRSLFLALCAVVLVAMVCPAGDLAAPELADVSATASAAPAVQPAGVLAQVWAYLNTSAGVTVLLGVITWILGRVFTAKPEWRVVYDTYRPALMQAVKFAEKEIPDDSPNRVLARVDAALHKAIQIDAAINSHSADAITQAIAMVHADAEAAGNI